MILATALATVAFAAGRVAAAIFPAKTIAGGGWLIGQWMPVKCVTARAVRRKLLATMGRPAGGASPMRVACRARA
jgi:hypothetical protein